jgi:hypothetical protein
MDSLFVLLASRIVWRRHSICLARRGITPASSRPSKQLRSPPPPQRDGQRPRTGRTKQRSPREHPTTAATQMALALRPEPMGRPGNQFPTLAMGRLVLQRDSTYLLVGRQEKRLSMRSRRLHCSPCPALIELRTWAARRRRRRARQDVARGVVGAIRVVLARKVLVDLRGAGFGARARRHAGACGVGKTVARRAQGRSDDRPNATFAGSLLGIGEASALQAGPEGRILGIALRRHVPGEIREEEEAR